MSQAVDRALMLIQQGRHELAVPELQRHLAAEPQDAFAHALIALCLSDQVKFADATRHFEEAIRLGPDLPFAHYAAGYVLRSRNRFDEALPHVQEAIRLEPYDADAFGLLAEIHLAEKRHQEALNAAEQGLEIDAENVTCQNLRAMALKNLGRHDAAADALRSALSKDPENSWTHANQGWALLEKNKHEEALQHFQEALRLDPTNEWAREGIVTALKSRHIIYAVMLKYFLWMSKLTSRAQWGVILGVYFGSRALAGAAAANPEQAWIFNSLRIVLFIFAVMTWIADPLFNMLLRISKYGRLALSRDQVNASNLLLFFILGAIVSVTLAFTIGPKGMWLMCAAASGLMLIPSAAVFKAPEGSSRRRLLAGIAMLMALLALAALGSMAAYDHFGYKNPALLNTVQLCTTLFVFGLLGMQLLANFSSLHHQRR